MEMFLKIVKMETPKNKITFVANPEIYNVNNYGEISWCWNAVRIGSCENQEINDLMIKT